MNTARSSYRKNLKVMGTMILGEHEIPFTTKNISLTGIQAYCTGLNKIAKSMEHSDMIYVKLPELSMEGVVSVLWTEERPGEEFHFGFKFVNMRGVEGSSYRFKESDFDNASNA